MGHSSSLRLVLKWVQVWETHALYLHFKLPYLGGSPDTGCVFFSLPRPLNPFNLKEHFCKPFAFGPDLGNA